LRARPAGPGLAGANLRNQRTRLECGEVSRPSSVAGLFRTRKDATVVGTQDFFLGRDSRHPAQNHRKKLVSKEPASVVDLEPTDVHKSLNRCRGGGGGKRDPGCGAQSGAPGRWPVSAIGRREFSVWGQAAFASGKIPGPYSSGAPRVGGPEILFPHRGAIWPTWGKERSKRRVFGKTGGMLDVQKADACCSRRSDRE